LKTPPPEAGILEGITREAVMELAKKAGIPVQETALTRFDVYAADECFLTGTGAEIISVIKVDGRVIGTGKPGPISKQLREKFHQLVRSPEAEK
jgi:branched-chain amino acid aminotransferase